MVIKNTLKEIINRGHTPIGELEDGSCFGLSAEDRSGLFCIYGNTAQGKSLTLENILISDIYNGRGGMFIDPYGDLVKEIQDYIPADKLDKVTIFEVTKKTLQENIDEFKKEIDLVAMQQDDQKVLLCKLDYRVLGVSVARDFGIYLVKQFLAVVGPENRTLGLDEAHNFIDDEMLEILLDSKNNKLSTVLVDQSPLHYRTDVLDSLHQKANHLICYYMQPAEVIHKYHPELNTNELNSLKKYHFWTKLNAQSETPYVTKAKGIFPIPYPKSNL